MGVRRFVVELNAVLFGEKSMSYQALQQEKELGGNCSFFFEDGHYTVTPRAAQ